MSMFSKIGSFFSIRDEEEDSYDDEYAAKSAASFRCRNAGRRGGTEVSVYSPRSYQDVVEIADALRNRQVVIVNLQNADRMLLQRVVDFTSGVAYTIDGKIQKLAEAIYLVVPAGVVVNAAGLARLDDGGRHPRFHVEQDVALPALVDKGRDDGKNYAGRHPAQDLQKGAAGLRPHARSIRFLDEMIETLEDEAQHRAALEAEIADLKERISHFKAMEESLQNTLMLAQRTADEVKASAHKEADLIRERRGWRPSAKLPATTMRSAKRGANTSARSKRARKPAANCAAC